MATTDGLTASSTPRMSRVRPGFSVTFGRLATAAGRTWSSLLAATMPPATAAATTAPTPAPATAARSQPARPPAAAGATVGRGGGTDGAQPGGAGASNAGNGAVVETDQ